jgi:SAM-dependent methyltransferase
VKLTCKTIDDLMLLPHLSNLTRLVSFWVRHNLFSKINSEGVTLLRLSKELQCSEQRASDSVYLLSTLGLLKEKHGKIYNTELTEKYLIHQSRHSLSDLFAYQSQSAFSPNQYFTQLCHNHIYDASLSSKQLYFNAMESGGRYAALKLVSKFFKNANGCLLDLGCGSGIFSRTACQWNPNLRSVCVDKAEVIQLLKIKLQEEKEIAPQIELMVDDILNLKLSDTLYDYILVSNVLHFFNKDQIHRILKFCRHALTKNGILIINDFFLRDGDFLSKLFSLEWSCLGNDFLSAELMKDMLERNQFTDITVWSDIGLSTQVLSANI